MISILKEQQNEITEHLIYLELAKLSKEENNKKILSEIANQYLELIYKLKIK